MNWRCSFRPDLITKDDVRDLPIYKYFKVYKHDKEGNSVVVITPGYSSQTFDIESCEKVALFIIEKAIRRSERNSDGKISVIFDRNMMTQSKDKAWFPLYKVLGQTLQDYYPERLKVAYVVNANWFTKVVISMCKVFLAKSTSDKVCVVKKFSELEEHIDYNRIPKEYRS